MKIQKVTLNAFIISKLFEIGKYVFNKSKSVFCFMKFQGNMPGNVSVLSGKLVI